MPGIDTPRKHFFETAVAAHADVAKAALAALEPARVGFAICDTVRTTSSAVRFHAGDGDPLLLLTVPGEPTAPFTAYLRNRSPAGPDRTLVVGYGQDYIGYVPTAEDWLSGGYEPSLNVWGPLEGEMALDGILDGAKLAWTPEKEDPEAGTSRIAEFPFPDVLAPTTLVTTDHGTVPSTLPAALFSPDTLAPPTSAQPDASIARAVGLARFVWLGGDPAIDFPRVVVERELTPGTFEPLRDALGTAASSSDGAIVLTYTPDPIEGADPAHHYYVASWQAAPPDAYALDAPGRPYALSLGTYRLRVSGRALSASGDVDYDLASSPFQVIAAPLASATAKRTTSALLIGALLGDAPGLRALRPGISDQALPLPPHGPSKSRSTTRRRRPPPSHPLPTAPARSPSARSSSRKRPTSTCAIPQATAASFPSRIEKVWGTPHWHGRERKRGEARAQREESLSVAPPRRAVLYRTKLEFFQRSARSSTFSGASKSACMSRPRDPMALPRASLSSPTRRAP